MNTIARSVLAAMLLLAGVSSAEAQEGLGTVVCVGSGLESMASARAVPRVISARTCSWAGQALAAVSRGGS